MRRYKHPEMATPPPLLGINIFFRGLRRQFPICHCRVDATARGRGGGERGGSISEPRVPSSVNDRIRCHCSSSDARCEERDNKRRLGRGVGREKGKKEEKTDERDERGKERKNGDFVIAHFLLRCH